MQKMLHKLILGIFLLSAAFANAQAFSDEELNMQRLQDRINSLEKNLITVQQELYKNSKGSKSNKGKSAVVSDEPIGIDDEKARAMNGKIEELQHNIDTLANKLDKIISDIDFRISALEKKVNAMPVADTNGASAGETVAADNNKPVDTAPEASAMLPASEEVKLNDGAAPTPATTPAAPAAPAAKPVANAKATAKSSSAAQYDKAFEYLRQAKYDEAEKAFKDFIANNKESDLLGNAYYWLGETYYSRSNYQQAAVNFLKTYQDFPKGNKAPDGLLKLAMSLKNLKKEKEACATIEKLKKEYPGAEKELLTKADAEKKALKCK